MSRNLACMEKWDGFFSCYRRTPPRGIHGTAIFTRRETATPLKAEEGLSHLLVPSEVPAGARIGGYPTTSQAGDDVSLVDMRDLDSEGRTTIADFGLFVVINLYCPNQTNDDRLEFKLRFNALIEARVRNLIKQGKQVIVVGDINICASPLDTCDAEGRARENGISDFMDHPARKWFSHLIGPDGILVDVTRRYHPDRERMFTCWNTKLDARVTNYGTRLDYILVTPGMLPWVKFSDILPDIYGSDHAPVFVDLHDEIEIEGRGTVGLRDELLAGRAPPPEGEYLEAPKFAARNWDEYSGKQRLLSSFFSAKPQPARAGSSGSLAASKPTPSPSPRMRSESSTPAPGSLASSSKANRAPPDVIDISSDSSESSPPPPSKPQKRQKSSSTSGQGLLTAFVRENSSSGDSKQGSSKRSNKKRESSEDKAESSKRAKLDGAWSFTGQVLARLTSSCRGGGETEWAAQRPCRCGDLGQHLQPKACAAMQWAQ